MKWLKKVWCELFGHAYYTSAGSSSGYPLRCKRCGAKWPTT